MADMSWIVLNRVGVSYISSVDIQRGVFLAVPLFILMGALLRATSIARRIVDFASAVTNT